MIVFDKNMCPYKKVCSLFNSSECNSSCERWIEISCLYEKSQLPKNKWQPIKLEKSEEDKEVWEIYDDIHSDIENFVNNGENLVLTSRITGNGKSSMAIKLIQKYFNEIWLEGGQDPKAYFIHVPTFLSRIKSAISKKDEELEEILNNIRTIPLVVFDDLDSNIQTNFENSTILSIIDSRLLAEKSMVFTTNLNESQVIELLGKRLASRIWNTSTILTLSGDDRRGEGLV